MKVGIKRSAIPASGYLYQTLVGIQLLCDWLDSPSLYEWVKFEADDEREAQGLDDIVAQRPDGSVEFIQVKFTVDGFDPGNALSWDWLTRRKGQRGKSLLEKWAGAFFRVGLARLSRARLITNRRPDATFALHLVDNKVRWSSLPEALREELMPHLGGTGNAERFFEHFEFLHSFAGYESLTATVASALEGKHTDHLGWLNLLRRSIEWSIHKSSPAPDGRITLEVLRSTISERQPRPLDQEFRVPPGYLPPDSQFADAFVDEVQSTCWNERVLWGAPGQGKSTFLSYLCEQLSALGYPVIRHHYFLDLQDTSERFTLKSVARSMMTQLASEFPTDIARLKKEPEHLRSWLEVCGQASLAQSKRLIVIVDGLDHVWRENDEQILPLNELFNQLLPAPHGVALILGTQRVSDQHLPRRMNRHLGSEAWIELPRMQMTSIISWLRSQHEAGVFQLPEPEAVAQQLTPIAEALMTASEGHPLVLTYLFMKVAHGHRVISPAAIRGVDIAPHGDLQGYYKTLWQQLSWPVRDALHLLAEDSFIWPAGALELCLELRGVNLEVEIGHLLTTVDAGLKAFHGSLYVFITQQSDHRDRLGILRPKVKVWLATQASPYLRWAWLWLYEAHQGCTDNLLNETTRQWVLKSLTNACEIGQIVRILEAAESVAFEAGDFQTAIGKRALKHRVEEGLPYQVEDAEYLREQALQLTTDPYPTLLLASRLNQSSLHAQQQLASLYLALGQVERAREVQERMRIRINDRVKAKAFKARDYGQAIARYLQVAAGTGRYDPARVLTILRRQPNSTELFERFLITASKADDLERVIAFVDLPMPLALRRVLEVHAVRVAAWASARLHSWQQFKRLTKHPLSICWGLLYQPEFAPRIPHRAIHATMAAGSENNDEQGLARYLHYFFFAVLARGLAGTDDNVVPEAQSQRPWLAGALLALETAASAVATELVRGGHVVASVLYSLDLGERPAHSDHEAWSDLRAMRRALVLITADVFLLTRARSGLQHIPAKEWEKCKVSRLFALEHWQEDFLMCGYRLLDDATAQDFIAERAGKIRSTVAPFNEQASSLVALCSWATSYGLTDLAHELLEQTYAYAIGYGWRKDPSLAGVLEVVAEIAKRDPAYAVRQVRRLAPIFEQIDAMTEDSGSRPCDLAALLWQLLPDIYVRYYQHFLDRSEWYYADCTFSVLAEHIDLSPESTPALSIALGEQTVSALRTRAQKMENPALLAKVRLWGGALVSDSRANNFAHDQVDRESQMVDPQRYPPTQLRQFLAHVHATIDYQHRSAMSQNWLAHWEHQGNGMEVLQALEELLDDKSSSSHFSELLDPAFHLSLRLQGAKRAFMWLIRAHQYRYGWSERYHGYDESLRRLEILGEYYPSRWKEFLAKSSLPPPGAYVKARVIPDTGLVRLLIAVGELQQAKDVLSTLIDILIEEFSVQPLAPPQWWPELNQ
ncbi:MULTISPECIES: ATP-binding protein [unclassified Pseudomonas]|uniref:ATP-binding protein n=1 Tax=unclassified Pseudomonas TaxID=196821 RepID=UPI001AE42A71|nr:MULTISPECIES: ATP-binding protein [unclassified Pseudomonas]MBP2271461.1 hypothetical protein [Pseudomonas sp. BP6]MBP2289568.1 hypothetical protein [Pseudomonas sp. BP7]HDS1695119.1 ATP-binding protein [Pseudomonas putida]HDS1700289.1 ATP-binding protein [Pseudomonas putida]